MKFSILLALLPVVFAASEAIDPETAGKIACEKYVSLTLSCFHKKGNKKKRLLLMILHCRMLALTSMAIVNATLVNATPAGQDAGGISIKKMYLF